MSGHRLRSAIRYAAEQAQEQYAQPRLGLRTSYDPTAGAVKVMLQPENVETGWLPLKPIWQGNGWGMFAPPPAGSQCIVLFQEGHPDCGFCLGAIPSDADRPLPVPDGELWLVHQAGAFIKLTNDGKITTSGEWVHTGDISVTGEVTAKSQGDAIALSTHLHPLQGPGSLETGAPLPE